MDFAHKIFLSFSFFCFSLWVAGAVASAYAATPLNSPTQTGFCLNEIPNGSNQHPRYNQAHRVRCRLVSLFPLISAPKVCLGSRS